MEARYLIKGDTILRNGKRYKVVSISIKRRRVIAQTDGGRLSFRPDEQVVVD